MSTSPITNYSDERLVRLLHACEKEQERLIVKRRTEGSLSYGESKDLRGVTSEMMIYIDELRARGKSM